MIERLGQVGYWSCSILAALWVITVVIPGNNTHDTIVFSMIAGGIWLVGYAFRYVLAGPRT